MTSSFLFDACFLLPNRQITAYNGQAYNLGCTACFDYAAFSLGQFIECTGAPATYCGTGLFDFVALRVNGASIGFYQGVEYSRGDVFLGRILPGEVIQVSVVLALLPINWVAGDVITGAYSFGNNIDYMNNNNRAEIAELEDFTVFGSDSFFKFRIVVAGSTVSVSNSDGAACQKGMLSNDSR